MNSEYLVRIAGTGVALPERVLTAAELDAELGLPTGEVLRVTGVAKRHTAVLETAAQLAAQAVGSALADAGMGWSELDCLVCASATMDQALPYNAAMVLAELKEFTHRVSTLDVGASCLSFLQALDLMSNAISTGRYANVVIVSADISTFTTTYTNLRENGIFGDGAAAVVLRRGDGTSRIHAVRSVTLPEGVEFCQIRSGGSRYHRRGCPEHSEALFEMRGRQLYALAARELPGFVETLLAEAGVKSSDLALMIPHQASRQALDHVAKLLGFDDGRMVDVFGEFGNQVGASLPTALHFGIHLYGLQRGQKALLLGTGAGVSIGGIVFTY
ncbi:3-oxoacyl-[acyl-carrier-protein] synthase III C-terminal domain-containing protein [Synechococcus sp. CBW1004]|uniref:3-oxoacyl-[acyl-carrier-protein] synthase III C-terminal domain-containing protein n=1 Tax=Synechococcus sp. CBW1004 TaxID=1353136 RepID=UPI0018CD0C50|nr:3-oxoacyl-[acyl-carrier-protein] synthase III C-terminal domain-containing protein [Synechococcus sp. CBW1004]QPN64041.1 3-oxoacyl-ACP synthase [Synechococcus sp. CBW1004]